MGFRVFDQDGSPIDEAIPETARPNPLVEIGLLNERYDLVISESRPLQDWEWNHNMVQIRGEGHDETTSTRGDTRFVRVGVKQDGGWGTTFEPRLRGQYTLIIKMLEPDPKARGVMLQPVIETYVGSL